MASRDQEFDPRFDPAFQRGFDGPVMHEEPAARVAEAPAVVVDERMPRLEPPVVQLPQHPEPASLAGNPWVRALWVIAVVLPVAAIAGQAWAVGEFSGNGGNMSPYSYVVPSVVQQVSPWLLTAGLGSGIGAVFLHAVRWRSPE